MEGRVDIQDTAPEGELARTLHLVAAGIAGVQKGLRQGLEVRLSPHLQLHGELTEKLGRQGALHQGVRRGDDHAGLPGSQDMEGCQTVSLPLPGGHGNGPQLPLPGQQQDGLFPREGPEVSGQLPSLPLIRAEEQGGAVRRSGHCRTHAGALHLLQPCNGGGAAASIHAPDQLRDLRQGLQFFQKFRHGRSPFLKILEVQGNGYRTPRPKDGGVRPSKKWRSHFFEKDAACCSAHGLRETPRTFAGREVFLATYTPPPKTDYASFAPAGAKLCEAFAAS